MKCTSKRIFSLLCVCIFLTGCGQTKYSLPYTADSNISSFSMVNFEKNPETAESFASKLCVVDSDIDVDSVNFETGTGAGLFDVNQKDTIFAKNIHETVYPASLTKIMTAIVAMKNGSSDMILTASSNCKIKDPDAQIIKLSEGDTMTLDQALHILLIYSANDVAIMIAEGIGGSVENFVAMMNEEALNLGCTKTHFTNPNGLSEDDHYSTPYDLYLMMNEATKFEKFNEIIHTPEYQTIYYSASGNEKEIDIKSTNSYITNSVSAPSGITVIGGKTGTTTMAGHCLVLLSRDTKSNPYIGIVMKSKTKDDLYSYMNQLLSKIGN